MTFSLRVLWMRSFGNFPWKLYFCLILTEGRANCSFQGLILSYTSHTHVGSRYLWCNGLRNQTLSGIASVIYSVCHSRLSMPQSFEYAGNVCGIHKYDLCIFLWEWKKWKNNLSYVELSLGSRFPYQVFGISSSSTFIKSELSLQFMTCTTGPKSYIPCKISLLSNTYGCFDQQVVPFIVSALTPRSSCDCTIKALV